MTGPTPICFVDVETDGLHPGRRIWEYAIIRRDFTEDGSWTETVSHQYVALDLRNSDPFGLNVGGFWDRHPAGRKISGKARAVPVPCPPVQTKHDAARDIMRLTFGAHLVGVNPAFDADTMAGLLRAEGYMPAWDYHLEDLVAETAGYLRALCSVGRLPDHVDPAVKELPWKSDELAASVGAIPAATEDRHTALGDARWAMRWHDALTGLRAAEAGA